MDNISQQPVPPQPLADQPVSPSNQSKKLLIILVIVALIAFGLGGYLLGTQNNQLSQQNNTNQISPTQSAIPTTQAQITRGNNCLKEYKNEEHGFSFMYPCRWGEVQEKWTLEDKQFVTGNELALEFTNLVGQMEAGGASSNFSVGRGSIFQDISDKYWTNYLNACSSYLLCQNDKTANNKIIARLIFSDRFILENNQEEQVTVPQFDTTFRKEAYFDIDNAKISIAGFKYYFISDKGQLLAKLSQTFPAYVKLSRKINTGAAYVTLTEAKTYNQDIEKMKMLVDKNEFQLPFDAITKQNISDFDSVVSSFKFTK